MQYKIRWVRNLSLHFCGSYRSNLNVLPFATVCLSLLNVENKCDYIGHLKCLHKHTTVKQTQTNIASLCFGRWEWRALNIFQVAKTRVLIAQWLTCLYIVFRILKCEIFNSVIFSSVSSVTRLQARGQGFHSQPGQFPLITTASRPVPGPTQPPIQWVQGTLPTRVWQPEREADNWCPSSAEIRNSLPYVMDNFTTIFIL
jgi:hypothetical protein